MKEVAEKPIDVAKSSYGHFLVCRLIALAGKEELAGQQPAWASQHCSAHLTARYCLPGQSSGVPGDCVGQ